jgi:hypothetical protein
MKPPPAARLYAPLKIAFATATVRPQLPQTSTVDDRVEVTTEQLLHSIRLIRRGFSHATIVFEAFGDSASESAAGHRALRRLRTLGFSVAAERAGRTDFSRRLVALTRSMAGRPPHEIEKAIDELLHGDEPNLRRRLAVLVRPRSFRGSLRT